MLSGFSFDALNKRMRRTETKRVTVGGGFKIPRYLAEKKLAIQQAITPEMLVEALADIWQIAKNAEDVATRLVAYREFMDRTIGRPQKEVFNQSVELKLEAQKAELEALSEAQLEQIEAIMQQPALVYRDV